MPCIQEDVCQNLPQQYAFDQDEVIATLDKGSRLALAQKIGSEEPTFEHHAARSLPRIFQGQSQIADITACGLPQCGFVSKK